MVLLPDRLDMPQSCGISNLSGSRTTDYQGKAGTQRYSDDTEYLWASVPITAEKSSRDAGQQTLIRRKTQMKTKKVVGKIFDVINYSKKLKISSILPDRDSDYAILLELEDGSKFEIIIIPTRRFV